jgi:hypothetical protein
MAQNGNGDSDDTRDMLYLVGGVALVVLGAGLIATHPSVRKSLATAATAILPDLKAKLPDLSSVGTDVQRYLSLKSM